MGTSDNSPQKGCRVSSHVEIFAHSGENRPFRPSKSRRKGDVESAKPSCENMEGGRALCLQRPRGHGEQAFVCTVSLFSPAVKKSAELAGMGRAMRKSGHDMGSQNSRCPQGANELTEAFPGVLRVPPG